MKTLKIIKVLIFTMISIFIQLKISAEDFGILRASGERNMLVIMWNHNIPGATGPDRSSIQRLFFGRTSSVRDYFLENSGGRFTIGNRGILGWYDADLDWSHYWEGGRRTACSHGFLLSHMEKWAEAIRKADRDFDFRSYDYNRNRRISIDELCIVIVEPSSGGTEGYAQRKVYAREVPREFLIVDGVIVEDIVECYIPASSTPASLGIVAHELSHQLFNTGDMYHLDERNRAYFFPYAAGVYSLMDNHDIHGQLDPFHKLKAGWLRSRVITSSGWHTLRNVEDSGEVFILEHPTRSNSEYYIIENRWPGGPSYDSLLPNSGLAIWHIIENRDLVLGTPPPRGVPAERWRRILSGPWGGWAIRMLRPIYGPPFDDTRALWDGAIPERGYDILSVDPDPNHATLRWADGTPSGFAIRTISDAGPNMHLYIQVGSRTDTTPPSIPGRPELIGKTFTSITFSWEPSTDDDRALGYRIYRDGRFIGISTTNSFSDTLPRPFPSRSDVPYTYSIAAYDRSGNLSRRSISVRMWRDTTQPRNLARDCSVEVSSEYNFSSRKELAVDGGYGIWDSNEWASRESMPWIRFRLTTPQWLNKIILYGRTNPANSIRDAMLYLHSGGMRVQSIRIGILPSSGVPKEIVFDSIEVDEVRLVVTDGAGPNVGLSEFMAFDEPDVPRNLARDCTVEASSQYSFSSRKELAVDSRYGIWNSNEWASRERRPWIRFRWGTPQGLNKIVLYSRNNPANYIRDAMLYLHNGGRRVQSIRIGMLPSGGVPKEIVFDAVEADEVRLVVTGGVGPNVGLSEFMAFDEPDALRKDNLARDCSVEVSSEYDFNSRKELAVDNRYGIWDSNEWASRESRPWIRFRWTSPQRLNKIVLYSRNNPANHIRDAMLHLYKDGMHLQSMHIGMFPPSGVPKEIVFESIEADEVRLVIIDGVGLNVGLSEFMAFTESDILFATFDIPYYRDLDFLPRPPELKPER